MTTWHDDPLADLRHHWGSAYLIEHLGPDMWVAQRRDSRQSLGASTSDGLLEKIQADYAERPVPRDVAPPEGNDSALRIQGPGGTGGDLHAGRNGRPAAGETAERARRAGLAG